MRDKDRKSLFLHYLWTYFKISLVIWGIHAAEHICTGKWFWFLFLRHEYTIGSLHFDWGVDHERPDIGFGWPFVFLTDCFNLCIAELVIKSDCFFEHSPVLGHLNSSDRAALVFDGGLGRVVEVGGVAIHGVGLEGAIEPWIHFRYIYINTSKRKNQNLKGEWWITLCVVECFFDFD